MTRVPIKESIGARQEGPGLRFQGAHKLRPVCRHRCNAMQCYSQAQGEGPLQLKYSSQLNTATHIVLNIGPVSAFWASELSPAAVGPRREPARRRSARPTLTGHGDGGRAGDVLAGRGGHLLPDQGLAGAAPQTRGRMQLGGRATRAGRRLGASPRSRREPRAR